MSDLYSRIFNDIFSACEPYLMHDLISIRGDSGDKQKFCLFSYKKVFEEAVKILIKSRYNGKIRIQDRVVFDRNNIYSGNEIVKSSSLFTKEKILFEGNTIKLANARDTEQNERLTIIPIDGIGSFMFGNSDFAIVLIIEENNGHQFDTKNITIFNPIRRDIFSFDINEGCKYNNKKISNDNVYESNVNNIIYVNDGSSVTNFDLTKLAQMTNHFYFSKSIFSSLVELMTTNRNMCIYKINQDMLSFVLFICKVGLFNYKQIGEHAVIEKKK